MLYMVVERYVAEPGPVYERAATHGRMLPEGLRYIDSWIVDDAKLERCFQLNGDRRSGPPRSLA